MHGVGWFGRAGGLVRCVELCRVGLCLLGWVGLVGHPRFVFWGKSAGWWVACCVGCVGLCSVGVIRFGVGLLCPVGVSCGLLCLAGLGWLCLLVIGWARSGFGRACAVAGCVLVWFGSARLGLVGFVQFGLAHQGFVDSG